MDYFINTITIIFGIIVGYIIFKIHNVEIHGPNSSIVKQTIHKKNNKCYVFEPHLYMCA